MCTTAGGKHKFTACSPFFFLFAKEETGNSAMLECHLTIEQALPLVCLCSLLSFLCGVGIGGNDLSANFAMVVGSGSLNMKQAIVYCVVFELLGAFFMGGHVSNMIRNGIINTALFDANPDMVVGGMTCATFSAALWLYLSTSFGLPVSITHTVVGSVLGFGIFSVGSFEYVRLDGLKLIVTSWLVAPIFSALATAALFWMVRRYMLSTPRRSLGQTSRALPYCMFVSLIIDVGFIFIEQPPLLQRTLNRVFPTPVSFTLLTSLTALVSYMAHRFVLPAAIEEARSQTTFCWESEVVTTTEPLTEGIPTVGPFDSSYPSQLNGPDDGDLSSCGSSAVLHRQTSRLRMSSMSVTDGKVDRTNAEDVVLCTPAPRSHPSATSHVLTSSILRRNPSHQPPAPADGEEEDHSRQHLAASAKRVSYGATTLTTFDDDTVNVPSVHDGDGEDDEAERVGDALAEMMSPIRYGDSIVVRHFNPQSEFLFTVLQVLAGSMSSFVHGAVAGANATATFVILYDTFARHYLKEAIESDSLDQDNVAGSSPLSVRWAILPAMLGIAIGMISLGARLMKTVGMDLVTVTPARGWCMQVGGTLITMICTGVGIPVSLSQCQIGAAIGCGVTDAGGKMSGVSWRVVLKIMAGWVFTLLVGSATTGLTMRLLAHFYCGMQFYAHNSAAPSLPHAH